MSKTSTKKSLREENKHYRKPRFYGRKRKRIPRNLQKNLRRQRNLQKSLNSRSYKRRWDDFVYEHDLYFQIAKVPYTFFVFVLLIYLYNFLICMLILYFFFRMYRCVYKMFCYYVVYFFILLIYIICFVVYYFFLLVYNFKFKKNKNYIKYYNNIFNLNITNIIPVIYSDDVINWRKVLVRMRQRVYDSWQRRIKFAETVKKISKRRKKWLTKKPPRCRYRFFPTYNFRGMNRRNKKPPKKKIIWSFFDHLGFFLCYTGCLILSITFYMSYFQ